MAKKVIIRPRSVTWDEVLEAAKIPDNAKLINRTTGKFELEKPDKQTCGLIGLKNAMECHDYKHSSRQKFTTSLCNFVRWECIKLIKKVEGKKNSKPPSYFDRAVESGGEAHEIACHSLETLNPAMRRILDEFYVKGYTKPQISKMRNMSIVKVETLLKRAEAAFRESCIQYRKQHLQIDGE